MSTGLFGSSDKLFSSLAGRYRIERELGAGGMATVYLAEDVRHHRKVAIKVLHPELSAVLGAERFLKEIELTAGLQHPHILPLFDSGDADGLLFYVMPYVEGESLRARLVRERQLPVSDALRIATEVADALDYAHKQGVVHRDVKPENVLLHAGRAVVADFGIALAVHEAGGHRMTQTGLSLGTPQYMAPEQAAGERGIDVRADIYALGTITYEMLVGEAPFTGPSAQAILAKVMTEDPKSITLQRRSVPAHVDAAVLTALEKLPADRFASAADFARALNAEAVSLGAPRRVAATARTSRRVTMWLAAIAGGAALFALGATWANRTAPSAPSFGAATKVTWDPGMEILPAISPDGKLVTYGAGISTKHRIFVRPVAGGRAVPLTADSSEHQSDPRWSPDGTKILYLERAGAFSVPSSGGVPRQEVPAGRGSIVESASWSPDGNSIAFVISDSVFVKDRDAAPRLLTTMFEPALCSWSPDGAYIACASGNARYSRTTELFGNISPSRIIAVRVSDGRQSVVTDNSSLNHSPVWSADGSRLYFLSNRHGPRDIYVVPIDRDARPSGEPLRLTTGLDAHSFSMSGDGRRVAYSAYATTANVWSMPIPKGGTPRTEGSATQITRGTQVIETMRVSQDGQWLLFDSNLAGNSDIYRVRLPNGEQERLTTDPSDDFAPDLSPDGRELGFHSWRGGNRDVYVQPLDGGPVQRVTDSPQQELFSAWSADGNTLLFGEFGSASDSTAVGTIWISRRVAGGWSPRTTRVRSGFWSAFSPDGKRISYTASIASSMLFVTPTDSGDGQLIYDGSRSGGPTIEQPQWAADGRTIYFKSHDRDGNASFWSIPAAGGTPQLLVRFVDTARPSFRPNFAVGPDQFYYTIDDRQADVIVLEVDNK
ncbi:MAG TPA: protein kinase [Gemmatimonadaceae bacterium]|nr:protein kinase [Gemmatimonadaceae bacterium]